MFCKNLNGKSQIKEGKMKQLLMMALLISLCGCSDKISSQRYLAGTEEINFKTCTHINFLNGYEIVTDLTNSRFVYRKEGSDELKISPIELDQPHSLIYNKFDKLYYADDTDNHRIIAFRDIEKPEIEKIAHEIAGIKLRRPHDLVIDSEGWIYAINPYEPVVFRFKGLGEQESVLDLSKELAYSRALSLINDRVYVAGSSVGKVIEIVDFEKKEYNVYTSFGKKLDRPAGNWEKTGLVINDVDHYKGDWYATSFFTPDYSDPGDDYDKNKFIKFKNWDDFEQGNWQDLSDLIPSGGVPYYLTVYDGKLFVAVFGLKKDAIYKFESNIQK